MSKSMIKLSTLKPNEKNPRHISEKHLANLAKSIKDNPLFMELRPIIVDNNNVIIGGNQRFNACKYLEMKTIPDSWVKKAGKLTKKQIKDFVVVDNSPKGMSGIWDYMILQDEYTLEELQDLQLEEFILDELEPKLDTTEEFTDMPDFTQDKQGIYKTLGVYFDNEEDYNEFSRIIGIKLTNKTKSIWYPEKDQDQMDRDNAYISE